MTTPPLPPMFNAQGKKDADHLNLLSVFHFVLAGLALLGIGFILIHFLFMQAFLSNPEMWKGQGQKEGPPPEFFKIFTTMFRYFYAVMAVWLIASGVGNLLAGFWLRARRHRMFCMVISGFNCLHFPFGTALGVFTLIVLLRDSVRGLFAAEPGQITRQ